MNPFVGVSFELAITVILTLGSAAKSALILIPCMFTTTEADISFSRVELADRELAVRILGAVGTPAG